MMPKALATLTRRALQRILGHLKENGACFYQTDEYGNVIGPINLGNPVEFTIKQLAERVIDLTNSKFSNENPKDLPHRAPFSGPDLYPVNHERSLITRTTNTVNNTAALNSGASGL